MEKEKNEEKIDYLISSMTLEEKIDQLKAKTVSIGQTVGKMFLEDVFSNLTPEFKEKIMGFLFSFYRDRELAEEMTKALWKKMWKKLFLEGEEKKYPMGELSCALRYVSTGEC